MHSLSEYFVTHSRVILFEICTISMFFQIDHEAFSESFTNALHYLFLFGEANGNVDRVMQFVANFCGSLNNEGEEFMHYIFGVIFNVSIAFYIINNHILFPNVFGCKLGFLYYYIHTTVGVKLS